MPRQKGTPKTGGRKKGTPNVSTAAVKAALVTAFDDLGGVPSLVAWGRKNRTEFYRLWAKLLPAELNLTDSTPVQLEIVREIVRADAAEGGPAAPGSG